MCGIFGWWGKEDETALSTMADQLRHRGPDGEGFFHCDKLGLGMTRLAILDREGGVQPMYSTDSSVVVVCNGEIYNYKEVRKELTSLGCEFFTECDTEVIPAAYQQWGMNMLNKFNGMFALAVYDRKTEELIIARDRFGQKPIYHATKKGVFYFASEIRALHAIGIEKKINESAIADYLRLRYVPEPATMFGGVELIPAGCSWSSKTKKVSRWWQLQDEPKHNKNIDDLADLTTSAVGLALVSDEPLAIHLSAGVDSSILLAESVRQGAEVSAITAGFGARSDEVSEAEKFAKTLGVEHHVAMLSVDNLRDLPKVVEQMEVPVGDALIAAFDQLAQTTSEIGAKVALGGEGVDEAFGGYSFHKLMLTAERLGKLGRITASKVLSVLPHKLINQLSSFPADLGDSGIKKVVNYLRDYDRLSEVEKGIQLRTLFNRTGVFESRNLPDGATLLDRQLLFQFNSWMQDWAIIRQERNSMGYSVEYRMPFLDHRLVKFGLATESSKKFSKKEDKVMWRKLAATKYPEIGSSRVKQPFYFPMEDSSYYKVFEELWDCYLGGEKVMLDSLSLGIDYQSLRIEIDKKREFLPIKQGMALIILEIWLQQHFA